MCIQSLVTCRMFSNRTYVTKVPKVENDLENDLHRKYRVVASFEGLGECFANMSLFATYDTTRRHCEVKRHFSRNKDCGNHGLTLALAFRQALAYGLSFSLFPGRGLHANSPGFWKMPRFSKYSLFSVIFV